MNDNDRPDNETRRDGELHLVPWSFDPLTDMKPGTLYLAAGAAFAAGVIVGTLFYVFA